MARAAGDSKFYTFYLNGNLDGPRIELTSVTTILSRVYGANQGVIGWAYKRGVEGLSSPDDYREERAAEGTDAHDYLEALAQGVASVKDHADNGYRKAIATWWTKTKPLGVQPELVVYNLAEGYAGQCDLLYETNKGLKLVDLKTRAPRGQAYGKDRLQVTGYALAYASMTGRDVSQGGVLIAREDGTHTLSSFDIDKYADAWRNTVALWRAMERAKLHP